MTIYAKRLEALRQQMHHHQIDAYIVVSGDPHATEYLHPHYKTRDWLTGFTGSRGTALVTATEAFLWTDGRYYIQAEKELMGSGIQLMRIGHPDDPTLAQWLFSNLKDQATIGFDGMCMPYAEYQQLYGHLKDKQVQFNGSHDLIKPIWEDRPLLPASPLRVHPEVFCGESVSEKLARLRTDLAKISDRPYHHLICKLDDIAWLFNLRGSDIPNHPYFFAFALITPEKAQVFLQEDQWRADITDHLQTAGVTLGHYGEIIEVLNSEGHYILDGTCTPYHFVNMIEGHATTGFATLPTTLMKALKNPVEQENIRQAYLQDGVAMVKFLYQLKGNPEAFDELKVADVLTSLRAERPHAQGNSFDTICGYRDHGAMMHYKASKESSYALEKRGLVLVDSGGQYSGGTTDVTRTIALGPLTDQERFDYTLTLKAMRYLADVKFMHGATGTHLDSLCRHHMWQHGLDYKCGTGHGIGYHLGVHEGPQGMSMHPSQHLVVPGMILTDEPGIYREGQSGVRIEDTLLCIPWQSGAFGTFYAFENMTLVPYERDAIALELLSDKEIENIDAYHKEVYLKLAPHLDASERDWLYTQTSSLKNA